MARPLRIQYAGAIYHVMARGNGRQKIFREDRDYRRFLEGLEATVAKFRFEVFSVVCMPNHVHLFFRTLEPNLSRGMQYLLSGYANWFNTRHSRPGHLFQGRFKGELIEDERYFWNVSRYIHLNPVRGERPLVERPEHWPWSSYPGYRWKRRRVDWIAYDSVYGAWQGGRGGADPAAAYRRFVDAGISDPPKNPLAEAVNGWILGCEEFVNRIKRQVTSPTYQDEVPAWRPLDSLSVDDVLDATASHFDASRESFRRKRSGEVSRDIAAWVARRTTTATLRELSTAFGLGHPDSVHELIKRADRALTESPKLRREVELLIQTLRNPQPPKPETRV